MSTLNNTSFPRCLFLKNFWKEKSPTKLKTSLYQRTNFIHWTLSNSLKYTYKYANVEIVPPRFEELSVSHRETRRLVEILAMENSKRKESLCHLSTSVQPFLLFLSRNSRISRFIVVALGILRWKVPPSHGGLLANSQSSGRVFG